jgi:outer membrane protein assembly factor BamA
MGKILFLFMTAMILSLCSPVRADDEPNPEKREPSWGIGAHPIIGYDNKSSLTLGGGAVIYFEPKDGNRSCDELEIHSTYNLAKQYDLMASYDKYFTDNIFSINVESGYQNYPDDYDGKKYGAVFLPFSIGGRYRLHKYLYIGPVYSYQYSHVRFTDPIPLDDSTFYGKGKMLASGCGGQIILNTVPKDQIYRREGCIITLKDVYFSPAIGSDAAFNSISLDYRQYFPVFSDSVFAVQISAKALSGEIPFHFLHSLEGDKILRGGCDETGKLFGAAQAEFRFPLFWRIAAATFIGAGEVENKIHDFTGPVCVAGGAGLRITLNREKTINLRFDFAYNNRRDASIYIKIREAF